MSGATRPTEKVIDVVALPAVLVAVTVYEAEAVSSWGVPVILPFWVFRVKPSGNAGETDHEGNVPETVGEMVVIV